MIVRGGLKANLRDELYRIRGTVAFAGIIVVVYGVLLVVAGSLESGATYRVIEEYLRPNAGFYAALSPVVHSNHSHIAQNLVYLLIAGTITERVVGTGRILKFLYGAGVLSCIVPPFIGLGGFGVGISAANLGLFAFLGLFYATEYFRAGREDAPINRWTIVHLILAALGLFIALTGVLEFVGMVSTPPGVAKGGHLVGIFLGVLWFIYYKLDFEIERLGIWPRA